MNIQQCFQSVAEQKLQNSIVLTLRRANYMIMHAMERTGNCRKQHFSGWWLSSDAEMCIFYCGCECCAQIDSLATWQQMSVEL